MVGSDVLPTEIISPFLGDLLVFRGVNHVKPQKFYKTIRISYKSFWEKGMNIMNCVPLKGFQSPPSVF